VIRSNLATRPFYNERAVQAWLLIAAVIVAAATIFNVSRVLHYSQSDTALGRQAIDDERTAAELRAKAARERASVDARQIAGISVQAKLANDLIARRVFSWTGLFNRFATTLPANVRLTAIRPQLDDKTHQMEIFIAVVARGVDDVDEFMENLRKTDGFVDVAPNEEHLDEEGQLEAALVAHYLPGAPPDQTGPGRP
jgi:Tfp pilus assembly protein PilN